MIGRERPSEIAIAEKSHPLLTPKTPREGQRSSYTHAPWSALSLLEHVDVVQEVVYSVFETVIR